MERSSAPGVDAHQARKRIIRRYARYNSPFQAESLRNRYGFDAETADSILDELEKEQILIYGTFRENGTDEWYHSTVLERLRHSSMRENRESAKTADVTAFADFLSTYQSIGKDWVVPADGLLDSIVQLKGLYLPAEWWETILFPARVPGYKASWLDTLCSSGKVFWRIRNSDNQPRLAFYTMEDLNFAGTTDIAGISESADGASTANAAGDADDAGIAVTNGTNIAVNPAENSLGEREKRILSVLKRRGACFLHTLAADPSVDSGNLLQDMENLFWKGLVVNDSFEAVRYFLSGVSDNAKRRAQKRSIAYRMEMGRWEIPQPVREPELGELLERYLKRWGLLTREVLKQEESPYSWTEAYELLKQWEYVGKVKRGYYFAGLSGIQYTLPHLSGQFPPAADEFAVMTGCDTAQIYGRICSFPSDISWTNLPSTVVVLQHGVPVLVAERWGERISFRAAADTFSSEDAVAADGSASSGTAASASAEDAVNTESIAAICMQALADAFHRGQIWPSKRKITIKQWNGNPPTMSASVEELRKLGFEREMQEMVLWRRTRY
jgi:ATP-dependent Lhr-like helicase